jgi:hypothetical protein
MKNAGKTAAALLLLAASATAGEGPRYVGRAGDDSGKARVEYRGKSYLVRAGDEIPGWGRVKSVSDEAVVVRHELSAEEKRAREDAGLIAPDVLDVRLSRGSRGTARANAGS